MMFYRFMWTNLFSYILAIRLYREFVLQFTCNFYLRQLQIPNAQTKYYEILPVHFETHTCNTVTQLAKLQIDIFNLNTTFRLWMRHQ